MRLSEKVAVVTGASSGLGKAIAEAFVSEGANTVCTSRSKARLLKATVDISEGPGTAIPMTANVRSWEDVKSLSKMTQEILGPIDILVNNAGVHQESILGEKGDKVKDIPLDMWDTILETNLRGVFLCTKAFLPEMATRGTGQLLHIGSSHGLKGRSRRGPYVASKFGLEGLHQTLALEMQDPKNLRSMILSPPRGGVKTGMLEHLENANMHDPGVIAKPAVDLVCGNGKNGGRYRATVDGSDFEVLYDITDFN